MESSDNIRHHLYDSKAKFNHQILKNEWNHLVRDLLTILYPTLSILGWAFLIISKGPVMERLRWLSHLRAVPVHQKDDQEDEVEERINTITQSWQAPWQGQHQLKHIIHMARHPPKPTESYFLTIATLFCWATWSIACFSFSSHHVSCTQLG